METLIPALGQPKLAAGSVADLRVLAQSKAEDYRAYAAECQQVANQWSGLIKDQYEKLALQWLKLADRVH